MPPSDLSAWPAGAGEMAARVRAFDWSGTPLGAIADWPPALRAMLDFTLASPLIASLAVGPERIFLYNDAAAARYGSRHPDALGRPLATVFAHEFDRVADAYDRVFAGESVHVPAQSLDPAQTGTDEVFEAWLTPVRDGDGCVIAAQMIGAAIGDRQRAEEALRKSEEKYRALFDAMDQGFCVIEKCATPPGAPSDWRFAAANPAFEEHIGVTGVVGRRLRELYPDADPAILDHYDAVLASGGTHHFEDYTKATGRWITVEAFPAHLPGQVAVLYKDITDRKQAEAALRASETRLHTLIEGVPQLIWRAVDHGHWTWASPQWTDYTAQPEPDSHGLGWLEAVHPDDRAQASEIWARAVDRGTFEADYRLRRAADRQYRWFQTRATPVRDAAGRIVEWLGTSTDVDDLRRLQHRQQLLVAELQHRVRNILTIVRSVFGRTVETGRTIEDVADHFKGRLDAMARTQVIVTQSADGLVDLENLIRDELLSVGIADGNQLIISGPEMPLPAKVAEPIGLAIHELTTNAIKYGALREREGKVLISWDIDMSYRGQRRLDLTWQEQGVPAISLNPSHGGFGRELIEEALPYRLGAETKLSFRGGGVCCSISLPLPDPGASAADDWVT